MSDSPTTARAHIARIMRNMNWPHGIEVGDSVQLTLRLMIGPGSPAASGDQDGEIELDVSAVDGNHDAGSVPGSL